MSFLPKRAFNGPTVNLANLNESIQPANDQRTDFSGPREHQQTALVANLCNVPVQ